MTAIKTIIDARAKLWTPDRHPTGYAYKLASGGVGLDDPGGMSLASQVDEQRMAIPAVISTVERDRVGDEVVPEGCDLTRYAKNAVVFFGHQQIAIPVGRSCFPFIGGPLHVSVQPGKQVTSWCFFHQSSPEGTQFFVLVKDGVITATSIGFNPLEEPERLGEIEGNLHAGFRFRKWELLEWSWVGVPCNPGCGRKSKDLAERLDGEQVRRLQRQEQEIRRYLSAGQIAGEQISPLVRKALEPLAEPRRTWAPGVGPGQYETTLREAAAALKPPRSLVPGNRADHLMLSRLSERLQAKAADPVRWNRQLSKAFDVEAQSSRPCNAVYDWVSRHIGCKVKHLAPSGTQIPSARMGSYLTGLKLLLADEHLRDVRNLLSNGTEVPPRHEVIRLNSKRRDDFLASGLAFYDGAKCKFVVECEPIWGGLSVTVYTERSAQAFGQGLLDRAWEWAKQNNFLKGEAFALSGEFLDRTKEAWGDVFLDDQNKRALQRVIERLNARGKDFANRGMILTGPPGTGKTLSGRIIRNTAKASFLWISSRDFHRSGSFGGMSFGFELARELAPSVLFIEDVDNWLYDTTVDLIKTEMDGIARSSGVLTILTTNFPERLPQALIDRPGRFHDVLHFALPTAKARGAMLRQWLPALPAPAIDQAVKQTDGYSGAHVYELAQFAQTLQEQDGLAATAALQEAIRKIEEQRELITQVQLQGSNYRPRQALAAARPKRGTMTTTKDLSENNGTEGGYAVPEGLSLLRVRCMKEAYPDKPDAEAKVSGLGYLVDDYEETDDSHDFHQERLEALDGDPGEDEIEHGIRAVLGKRKAEAANADDLESNEPPDTKPEADEAAKRREAAERRGAAKRKQDALPADGGAGLDTEEVADDAGMDLPQGAAVAQAVIDYVQGQLPQLEPEVRAVFEDVTNTLIEWAQDRYPDVAFGAAESPAESDPEAAVDAESAMTDELLDRYRRGQVGRAKLLAHVLRKRLSKRHKVVVRDAADHLEDLTGIEAGSPFTRTHKAACKAHHSAMRTLLRDLDAGLDDEEGGDDKAADLDVAAITKKLEGLEERRSTVNQAFYRLTGKRAE